MKKFSIHVSTILIFALFLTGCASVPLGTIWKMRNFDPLSAEPSLIRFAVVTDKRVMLSDGSTSMNLSYQSSLPEHTFSHTAVASIKNNAPIDSIAQELEPNQKITLFYLDKKDADALRLAQSKLRNIKAQNVEGEGSLSISVTQGCVPSELLESEEMLVTVFALFDPKQGYVKMISELNLLAEVGDDAMQNWVVCDA